MVFLLKKEFFMMRYAIIITIIVIPILLLIVRVKRDSFTRPKHASFSFERVKKIIVGWLLVDVLVPWLLIVFGCDGREYVFYPLFFHSAAVVVAFILIFAWAKK